MARPCMILKQMERVKALHAEDEECFLKIQLVDQNSFLDLLNFLQVRLTGHFYVHYKKGLISCFTFSAKYSHQLLK